MVYVKFQLSSDYLHFKSFIAWTHFHKLKFASQMNTKQFFFESGLREEENGLSFSKCCGGKRKLENFDYGVR